MKIAFSNAGCVFAYVCDGHRNNFYNFVAPLKPSLVSEVAPDS